MSRSSASPAFYICISWSWLATQKDYKEYKVYTFSFCYHRQNQNFFQGTKKGEPAAGYNKWTHYRIWIWCMSVTEPALSKYTSSGDQPAFSQEYYPPMHQRTSIPFALVGCEVIKTNTSSYKSPHHVQLRSLLCSLIISHCSVYLFC